MLGREILQFTTVYVDDIVITSPDINTHCERLDRVLNKLHKYGITDVYKRQVMYKVNVSNYQSSLSFIIKKYNDNMMYLSGCLSALLSFSTTT